MPPTRFPGLCMALLHAAHDTNTSNTEHLPLCLQTHWDYAESHHTVMGEPPLSHNFCPESKKDGLPCSHPFVCLLNEYRPLCRNGTCCQYIACRACGNPLRPEAFRTLAENAPGFYIAPVLFYTVPGPTAVTARARFRKGALPLRTHMPCKTRSSPGSLKTWPRQRAWICWLSDTRPHPSSFCAHMS